MDNGWTKGSPVRVTNEGLKVARWEGPRSGVLVSTPLVPGRRVRVALDGQPVGKARLYPDWIWEPDICVQNYNDLTLRELQTSLPWTVRYSRDFRATPMPHKDFAHALHHVSKAAGRLHGLCDNMDHDRNAVDDNLRGVYGKYVADLVVCAMRMANVFPGGAMDLQRAVQRRIEEKNGVRL